MPDAFKPKGRKQRGMPSDEGEQATSEYRPVLEWFSTGNQLSIGDDMPAKEFAAALQPIKGLPQLASKYLEPQDGDEAAVAMELVLEGLHQSSMLSRERSDASTEYKDMLKSMLSGLGED